jgi:uncharacterized protein (UPF0548 family)
VEKKIIRKKPGLVIPSEWGHPVIMRGEVEVRKVGGKKVLFPIRSFSKWAHRFLMNQVISGTGYDSYVSYTQLPLKDTEGTERGMEEAGAFSPGYNHFHRNIAVGDSDQSWSYEDYNLKSLKDWAASYNRRLDTTETDGSIKIEFQGTVQASSAYDIKEVGLFGNFVYSGSPYYVYRAGFLVSRDVLPSPIPVEQNDVVVVYYRITVGGT